MAGSLMPTEKLKTRIKIYSENTSSDLFNMVKAMVSSIGY